MTIRLAMSTNPASAGVLAVPQAAAELRVSVPTVRRWIADGAPVVRRGRRGRGQSTLVNPQAVAAWRASESVSLATAAAGLPDVIGQALAAALEHSEGLPKQRMAGVLCGAWYLAAVAVMDHLRESDPGIPDVTSVPLSIERLRKIAAT